MGKQINYYMDYESFLKVVQVALDEGCLLLDRSHKSEPSLPTKDLSITQDSNLFWLYLPELAPLEYGQDMYGNYYVNGNSTALSLALIEIGYSERSDKRMSLSRSRIYVSTGYYDQDGRWIARSERLTKVYDKLARTVKKLASFTAFELDIVDQTDGMYVNPRKFQTKVYATPQCLEWRAQGYEFAEFVYRKECYQKYLQQKI